MSSRVRVLMCLVVAVAMRGAAGCVEDVNFVRVGCYNDPQEHPRPLPEILENFRLPPNNLNWTDLNSSVVEECARLAEQKNYSYFGVQFWGECWSGPQAQDTYDRDGHSDECYEETVGMDNANMVYRLTGKEKECEEYRNIDDPTRSALYTGFSQPCDVDIFGGDRVRFYGGVWGTNAD
ncbi:uncharacterized protein LOC5505372 isoform X1 [Nematostella vectensis]|uniref:uncharacterized protein LOC5505372 isoform X1 n=1 Tax=Nematostella vectensis TaxID=45351 RepID=UPI0020775948|nr:uncharacterized protein LOC5505372 isoform X1 [Nematostella vectensis]XP_048587734.1 uncharacterized protein LOC5505372 isoform X1 [Nematostella vectensis]